LLDQAVRYYPILRVLKQQQLFTNASILEIGAGPIGLGQFRKVPFVGCDVLFPSGPQWPMMPVIATAAALPFPDRSFDAVLASDCLEHIPAVERVVVIQECLRVAGKVAIFGFPCGKTSQKSDRELFNLFVRRKLEVPLWLKEHMLDDFPEASLFTQIAGWQIRSFGNESIAFHSWLVPMETHRLFNYAMKTLMLLVPRLLESILRRIDSAPYYRQIFVLTRAGLEVGRDHSG
jgi:Methyltransferase domain